MVLIKGGTYIMGQQDGEGDERPTHQVTLDDFYLSAYEVTVVEYRRFCNATAREMPKEPDWGWQDDHPIINTSWFDAMAYIDWINEQNETHFRLPTEAEFEYVIRNGGEKGTYPKQDVRKPARAAQDAVHIKQELIECVHILPL